MVSEDNGSALTSAELNINYPRCVLTASFFLSSNETQTVCDSRGNKVRLLWEDKVTRKQKCPAAWQSRCGRDSNSAHRKRDVYWDIQQPKEVIRDQPQNFWKHSYKDETWETVRCTLRKHPWVPFQGSSGDLAEWLTSRLEKCTF